MRFGLLITFLFCTSCGAATPRDGSDPACRHACATAGSAWHDVAERAEQASRPTQNERTIAAEQVLERLEQHAQILSREPHPIEGDEAFGLSNAMMDAVDEVSQELPARLRERADDAAEALLTDRGEEGGLRAARDAAAVLEQVVSTVRPGWSEARNLRRALDSFSRRARSASSAYREHDPERGDTRADRAESAPLPNGAPAEVLRARQRALAASNGVRDRCTFVRHLSVPTL